MEVESGVNSAALFAATDELCIFLLRSVDINGFILYNKSKRKKEGMLCPSLDHMNTYILLKM